MHVNYRYLLDQATNITGHGGDVRILDYGCGRGEVVRAGRCAGLNIYGADVFFGGSRAREEVERLGILGTVICEIHEGRLDFPDAHFDLVVNNQVLEHVVDLEGTLREIHRVLKPGGKVVSLFPSRDVIREGHIGIPMAHWFPRNAKSRYYYTLALRTLGLGTFKTGKTRREWTRYKLAWIDSYTVYRRRRDIFEVFRRYFSIRMIEPDYLRFRLAHIHGARSLGLLLRLPLVPAVASEFMRRMAGMVIEAHKSGSGSQPGGSIGIAPS